jgi:iron-sulfur cluster assembly accessory protein
MVHPAASKKCIGKAPGWWSHRDVTLATGVLLYLGIETRRETKMTTTPTTPEVKNAPLTLTPAAIAKVKEIMAQQTPVPTGLRVGVVGGGCSGFSYSMQFENGAGAMDKTFEYDGLQVFIDATSLMYLQGASVDYIETLEGAGFKFENPNVKSTCGCGSSFSV